MCVTLVIYRSYTKIHSQENIKIYVTESVQVQVQVETSIRRRFGGFQPVTVDNVQNINVDSCSRTVHLFTSGPIYAGRSLIKQSWKRLRSEKRCSWHESRLLLYCLSQSIQLQSRKKNRSELPGNLYVQKKNIYCVLGIWRI